MAVDSGGGGVSVKEELGGDGGMVFTSTTEFSSRLEVRRGGGVSTWGTGRFCGRFFPSII